MIARTAAMLVTCVGVAAACGGSSNEANSPDDANFPVTSSAQAEFEASAEPEAYSPAAPNENDTQVTVDRTLMERCGLTEAQLYFPYDSAEVKGNGDKRVEMMANCLVSGNLKGKELVLIGYTDPRGTAEYNEQLGKSRAESIADLLVGAGMPKEKLVIKSAGEREASTEKDEWPTDRRVEVALVAD
jgi:peptidoglycan-associated lipoprotein